MNSNIKDVYSLTPSQEGIYAQYFQSTDTKTYHLQNLCRISKETDLDILKKSVELLSVRHQIFKTAFTVLKSTGAIKQVILENRKPKFSVLSQGEPFSQNALDKIIGEDIKKTLDLQKDSLLRITIVDFTDERFMLIHTHHIILDGWCLPVIINDLQKYYGELSKGISAEELSDEINKEVSSQTSYAQYVNWIKKQDKNEASGYWQNLLTDCFPTHIFGKEKKDNKKNVDFVTFETHLHDELSQRIEQFAKESKVSNNTVFECAFSIALQKYSGNYDVVFDKVISGRSIPLKNIENTVGPFINTVPVRIKSDESSTLADLIKETQKQTINANNYGILPLAEVYKACYIDNKSIDALFVFENYFTGDISDIEKGPLAPKLISFNEQTEFNLTVTILKEKNGYTIRTSYAKEMYTESDISTFIKGYISILDSSLDVTKQIKDISVTDTDFISSFNATAHSYDIPDNSTIFSLFEKIAKENTEKVCIKTAENDVTFGELLNISEKLDTEIRKITSNKKSVVAVVAERSTEMYGAIYGIIRGGNAYLPIDPDYPQDRIEYMLKNSESALVLCQDKFSHLVGKTPHINMTEFIKAPTISDTVLPCAAETDDTAYVIYTSGSTGNPKGAKVSHKSAVNRILWMHDKYPLEDGGVILQKTPYTFDVSVWEIFWWGMCGGSLAASKPGEHFLPAKILDEVNNNKVTHLHFVPSVFELFLNYLEGHKDECNKFASVRYVFLSGEALTANLVNRFYKLYDYSKVSLHNLYGPTECAVDVTYYNCTPTDIDPVPIGKPIYNTQMYVADKYMKPVPVGVTGELCIGGINVGQGYLNNEDLTAEKFIDNPFGEGKLYKTGDLAYWREDGEIIFCGRIDGQIKLNGQRIETGEIEAVIGNIPEVESVAVIIRKLNGRDTLVAFYCGKKNSNEAIRLICETKLPKYMVPAAICHIEKMPLNQSGKLDRKALFALEVDLNEFNDFEEPKNENERYICDAFSKVLEDEKIGRNSDFFEMGGTSLSMISLLGEVGFEDVTAAEFMRNPTPAMLSSVIKAKRQINLEYLEPLYISNRTEQVMVLLPFAGGGAEAYSMFVNSLKKKNDSISVYFIRYLHSLQECKKAADEIADILGESEILIYSHCVGSAVALQVISFLESKNISIKQYFAGALVPPVKPTKKNLWNMVPDGILKAILIKAGANIKELPDDKVCNLLERFRKDTDFANVSFTEFKGRINTPVSVVISKEDMFTKNYRQAEVLWKKYANNVTTVEYIDSRSHYFQSDNSELLVESLLKIII